MPDKGKYCELYLEDPYRRLVTYGKVYKLGPTIHHKQIMGDQVRVVVGQVVVADAPVPIPNDEVQFVGQAPNNFIAWPASLVQVVANKVQNTLLLLLLFYNFLLTCIIMDAFLINLCLIMHKMSS